MRKVTAWPLRNFPPPKSPNTRRGCFTLRLLTLKRRLVGDSPPRHRVAAEPAKLRVSDGRVTVVARDHHTVSVQARKVALVNSDKLRALEEDGALAV